MLSSSNLVHPRIYILFYKNKKIVLFLPFSIMNPTSNPYRSASKGEFTEPPPKPNLSSSGELHPSLKAMVRAQPFSGLDSENPCHHLLEFEEICSCLSMSGMTQEKLKWALFPFSLIEKVKQWLSHPILRIKWDAESYVHLEISHTHKPTNYK